MSPTPIVLLASALLVCGCATGPRTSQAAKDVQIVPMTDPYGGTLLGRAILVGRGDKTDVTSFMGRTPDYMTLPVHLYTYIYSGTCQRHDPKPAYALTRRVLTGGYNVSMGPFSGHQVGNTAPVALASLRGSPHAIEIRSSPVDGHRVLGCGNIS